MERAEVTATICANSPGWASSQARPWAAATAELLLELKGAVEAAKDAGQAALTSPTLASYRERYRQAIAAGYAQNPEPVRTGKRGRPRQGPARSLLLRLDQYEEDVLRFASDFNVPFDNNLSERDIRMVKLQQKISGCWRTREGADAFLVLRSYISTACKQGQGLLAVLGDVVQGEPWLPAAGAT